MPASDAGRLLAIADKLDSLVGLFSVGLAPKSTSDPYGLRRTALGIIQILVDQSISVDLRELTAIVAKCQPVDTQLAVKRQIIDFFAGRFDSWLSEAFPYPRDVVKAVLEAQAHDPARALAGISELSAWVKRDDWEALLDSFARCVRITRSETAQALDTALLRDAQEVRLHESTLCAVADICDDSNVDGFLRAFAAMVPAVTDFFDNVLVHSDDLALRNNRIALLQRISALQDGRADLSQLDNF